ncbi:class I SAM-dependent methyltransferase [Chelatococcus reniformis]|uniref:class I SAM-dependent methyltransferase n=1 Tax=Chelatococcus reniformis TaxID=1494448 RepID=UPI001FCE68BE|nr:class I SAM-dependent methyltransferase [Chelatococcus reniformis]
MLGLCADGELPPGIALAQLCLAATDEQGARHALAHALADAAPAPRRRLAAVYALWNATPAAFAVTRAVASTSAEVDTERTPATWARAFDAAAAISPEAAVALYSLGRPDLLASATAEIVDDLRARGVLGADRRVVDVGCGIGRILAALAPRVKEAVGIEVSAVMIAEARKRCAGLENITLAPGSGSDLAPCSSAAYELVLFVDSFPYVVASGPALVVANLREAHRVLRPRSRLLIYNYSYRGSDDDDRHDVSRLAGELGFHVLENGRRGLRRWDGAVFDLMRTG